LRLQKIERTLGELSEAMTKEETCQQFWAALRARIDGGLSEEDFVSVSKNFPDRHRAHLCWMTWVQTYIERMEAECKLQELLLQMTERLPKLLEREFILNIVIRDFDKLEKDEAKKIQKIAGDWLENFDLNTFLDQTETMDDLAEENLKGYREIIADLRKEYGNSLKPSS